jgi:biopolymer transport protein ExbD
MNAQSLFSNTSIKVDIPKANVIEVELDQSIPVTITTEDKVYVQDDEMPDLQSVTQKVKELQERYAIENNDPELKGQQLTVIRGDKSLQWGRILEVLDAVKKGGAKRVALAVVKRKGGG